MNKQVGILYGVGVGPGDARLLSQKAIDCIRESDIICLPQAQKECCRAYQIAEQAIPELVEKECLCLPFQMTRDESEARQNHKDAWLLIREKLLSGKNAAFLTIGDPVVFSTFAYAADLARAEGFPVETVNGIASFLAAAAVLGISLCEGNEELHIGTGQSDPEALLSLPGTKVFMKCGRSIPKIRAALRKLEQEKELRIYAVSNCGLADERRYEGIEELPESESYMTTIIVKENSKIRTGEKNDTAREEV